MNPRKAFLNARSYWLWRWRGRDRGRLLVRIVGDSHTKTFYGAPGFYVHHIGAATAFKLCTPGSSTRSREQLMAVAEQTDPEREALMLSFGEADCRIHIYNQFKRRGEKISIAELIENTVERYGQVMKELHQMGLRVIVYGMPPTTLQGNRYKAEYYATRDTHVRIYREFNARLRDYCTENDFLFIDVQEATSDADGFIAPEYAQGDAHLNSKVVPIVRRQLEEAEVL